MSRVFSVPKYRVTQTYEQHVAKVEASQKAGGTAYARGIDLVSQAATGVDDITSKIVAHSSGTVIYVGTSTGDLKAYGNMVILAHTNGYVTVYGHLKSVAVKLNQKVSVGTILGVIGTTGTSTGVHLHFEVRKYPSVMTNAKFLANIWGGFEWIDPTEYVDADLPGTTTTTTTTTTSTDYSSNTVANRFKVKLNNVQKGAYTNYASACRYADSIGGVVIDGTTSKQIYPTATATATAGRTKDYTNAEAGYFRIGKSWNKGCVGQIGAYKVYAYAKKNCKSGFKVFDNDGNVVYSA